MSYVLYFLLLLFNLKVTCDLDQFTTVNHSICCYVLFIKGLDANSVLVHGEGECDGLMTIQKRKGEERGCIDTYSARHFFCPNTYYINDVFL